VRNLTSRRFAWANIVALLLLCLPASPLLAAQPDGTPAVKSAYVTVQNGVFQINAHTIFPLNDDIRSALNDGVTLNFELQATVNRQRRYWFDATLVDVTLRRELSWHAVSERYVVRDPDRGEQAVYASLDQAVSEVGIVDNWPVVVEPQLDPDAAYEISVRASMRRGRLPEALRRLVFWSDSWNRSSDWYSWTLPR
jgi:Domain of unknown function (DUF4390)